jgi:CTP:phosphocholine cytidylyltransferase-like protein
LTLTAIVLAAGEGTRWGNYTGVPKHLLEIDGESLIQRTTRQIFPYVDRTFVVGVDSSYKTDFSELFVPQQKQPALEMHKFSSSQSLWSERTVILFGDVYYTDEAISTIIQDTEDFTFFLRSGPSSFTQKPYGEIYAFSFWDSIHEKLQETLDVLLNQHDIYGAGGWSLMRHLLGVSHRSRNRDHLTKGHYIEIDDWTEDFDNPIDFDRWLEARTDWQSKL